MQQEVQEIVEFKINDWVKSLKYKHLNPIQIESIYNSRTRKGAKGLKSGGTVLYSDEVELWNPEKDDFCWFWNDDMQPFLAQFDFSEDDEGTIIYWTRQGLHGSLADLSDALFSFKYCEPFVNKLPTLYNIIQKYKK